MSFFEHFCSISLQCKPSINNFQMLVNIDFKLAGDLLFLIPYKPDGLFITNWLSLFVLFYAWKCVPICCFVSQKLGKYMQLLLRPDDEMIGMCVKVVSFRGHQNFPSDAIPNPYPTALAAPMEIIFHYFLFISCERTRNNDVKNIPIVYQHTTCESPIISIKNK